MSNAAHGINKSIVPAQSHGSPDQEITLSGREVSISEEQLLLVGVPVLGVLGFSALVGKSLVNSGDDSQVFHQVLL